MYSLINRPWEVHALADSLALAQLHCSSTSLRPQHSQTLGQLDQPGPITHDSVSGTQANPRHRPSFSFSFSYQSPWLVKLTGTTCNILALLTSQGCRRKHILIRVCRGRRLGSPCRTIACPRVATSLKTLSITLDLVSAGYRGFASLIWSLRRTYNWSDQGRKVDASALLKQEELRHFGDWSRGRHASRRHTSRCCAAWTRPSKLRWQGARAVGRGRGRRKTVESSSRSFLSKERMRPAEGREDFLSEMRKRKSRVTQ